MNLHKQHRKKVNFFEMQKHHDCSVSQPVNNEENDMAANPLLVITELNSHHVTHFPPIRGKIIS